MMRRLRPRSPSAGPVVAPDFVPDRSGDSLLPNAAIVARREYVQRVRTRAFLLGTVFLMLLAFGAALIPAITTLVDQQMVTRIAVYSAAAGLAFDPAQVLETSLNGSVAAESGAVADPGATTAPAAPAGPGSGAGVGRNASPGFAVSSVTDLAAARAALMEGRYDGLVVITRSAGGDPSYQFVTDAVPDGRVAFYVRQGALAIAIQDRVDRLGLTPGQSGELFAPLAFEVTPRDPTRPTQSATSMVNKSLTSTVLVLLILVTVITYGTWVAMSVAEEKSSRVMELMLSAATPRQMLAGKVTGTGGAGITQYAGILAAGLVGIALQGPITRLIAPNASSDATSLAGLTPEVLGLFAAFFVLGFALYALIYAAAGSLVSRQEEVQQVITPLTFISMAGYFGAVFASSAGSTWWVVLLSYIPFTSPYVMLVRVVDGTVEPFEPFLALAILAVSDLLMLAVAARVYSAGVLLYGQRPTMRTLFAAMRIRS